MAFERQVYAAQSHHREAGDLTEPGGPPALGPAALAAGRPAVLGNNTTNFVFPMGEVWKALPRSSDGAVDARNRYRESVARGHDVFFFRTFWIRDAMHLNTVGLGNPVKRTCATCHGMHMTGMDTANGWMDIGTTNLPWASEPPQSPWSTDRPEMPLFKLTCRTALAPHPFLGRVIYTQDPGRALVSGKCNDIGTIVEQQFRGLAARAPYFSNGSARTLPGAGRFLRPPLQHPVERDRKAGSRQLPQHAMTPMTARQDRVPMIARTASLAATLVVLAVGAGGQEPARRNFVACPIVQDTKTVPCWLSEYEGEALLPRHSDRHQRRVPPALPRPPGAGRGNGVIRAAHLRRHRAQARARLAAPGARLRRATRSCRPSISSRCRLPRGRRDRAAAGWPSKALRRQRRHGRRRRADPGSSRCSTTSTTA